MKALIFNSGLGKRMGALTKNAPKCMVKLLNGETIFERQIRILSDCGIKEFVITTGPFKEQLITITRQECYKNLKFTFVQNDLYKSTNYIYSFYLTKSLLDDDFLLLHGDLVFEKKLVNALMEDNRKSLGLVNKSLPLPQKDFKCRIINNFLVEVGINIFDENCFTFQPFYKLSKSVINDWIEEVSKLIEIEKKTNVYAEEALNNIAGKLNIEIFEYHDFYINEIDNLDDYNYVSAKIQELDYLEQEMSYDINDLDKYIAHNQIKSPFVVIDKFLLNHSICQRLNNICSPKYFSSFQPNPLYDDCIKGCELFLKSGCDSIIAIGGGSCIDTAKGIKSFIPLNREKNCLEQKLKYINLKLIAIPTTAGTGSESTRYAAIYLNGKKYSLTADFLIPSFVIFNVDFLETLPLNQKKATIFDALCQCIESYWSKNATIISRKYASEGIALILKYIDKYLINNNKETYQYIYKAANLSGQAINISQTTAAHAMSYKLTSLYKIPHGQAVAICLPHLWEILYKCHTCNHILINLERIFQSNNPISIFNELLDKYKMKIKIKPTDHDLNILVQSINMTRLSNFPYVLSSDSIRLMYQKALGVSFSIDLD